MLKKSFLKIALMGVMLATASPGLAQEKITIGIMPFTGSENGKISYFGYYQRQEEKNPRVQFVQDEVEKSFVKTNRFIVVDRTKMNALAQEKHLRKTEDFIDSESDLMQQGKNLGADYLVSGNVEITPSSSGNVNLVYFSVPTKTKEKISAILKIIKVETGEIIKATTLKSTREKIEEEIDKFVSENFPCFAAVVEVQDKKVLITAGFKKGDVLSISKITVIDVQGKKMERKKIIGTVKVDELEGDFCVCTIKSGDNEMATEFKEKAHLQASLKQKN